MKSVLSLLVFSSHLVWAAQVTCNASYPGARGDIEAEPVTVSLVALNQDVSTVTVQLQTHPAREFTLTTHSTDDVLEMSTVLGKFQLTTSGPKGASLVSRGAANFTVSCDVTK